MKNVNPNTVKTVITGVNALDENSKFGQIVSLLLNEEMTNAITDEDDKDGKKNEEGKDTPAVTGTTIPDLGHETDPEEEGGEKPAAGETPAGDAPAASPAGEAAAANEDSAADDDKWAELDKYRVDGGNEYDFTNASDEDVVKVFKLIKGDDKVKIVKKDGSVKLKDDEAGVEYVIELGNDTETDNNNETEMKNEPIFEVTFGECGMGECGKGCQETTELDAVNRLDDGTQCHCYGGRCTCGRHMEEPMFDIDIVPGNGDENMEEASSVAYGNKRLKHLSNAPKTGNPFPQHLANEDKERLDAIIKENNELKGFVSELAKVLNEEKVIRTNLENVNKLMLENSTTKDEKENIVRRFANEAKTVEDSNKIYEQISSQLKANTRLNENKIPAAPVVATPVAPKSTVSETKVYESTELMESLDLMNRVDKLML